MAKNEFTAGCQADIRAVLEKLDRALKLTEHQPSTFHRRVLNEGSPDLAVRIQQGRLTIRRLASVDKKLSRYLEEHAT